MDMNIILSAVGSVGFPICAFFLLFWLVKEDLNKLTEAVNNNTKSTELLCTLIKNQEDKRDEK